jgi:tRNA (cytidine32/uridine32-2'-O)-methyltransferase
MDSISPSPLSKLRIVLVRTSHAGNIGAVARAMKNMGLAHLYLVQPKKFPSLEASALAAGADDILTNAVITDSLEAALGDCQLVIGTSVRERYLHRKIFNPKECAQKTFAAVQSGQETALVFGTESSGLSNEDLKLCQYQVTIPSDPNFASLNLAAAVLLIAYEIRAAAGLAENVNISPLRPGEEIVTQEDLERFYVHLEEMLMSVDFLDAKNPRHLMGRLRLLFGRTHLSKTEVNILRGILTAILKKTARE